MGKCYRGICIPTQALGYFPLPIPLLNLMYPSSTRKGRSDQYTIKRAVSSRNGQVRGTEAVWLVTTCFCLSGCLHERIERIRYKNIVGSREHGTNAVHPNIILPDDWDMNIIIKLGYVPYNVGINECSPYTGICIMTGVSTNWLKA